MTNHVRRHRFPLNQFACGNTKIETYFCKDCNFKTELTVLFKERVGKYHGIKRESRDDLLSEDFRIQNYVCEKCNFETTLSLKYLQHTSACTENKQNYQIVTSPTQNDTYSTDFKRTEETHWYSCAQCSHKAKFKSILQVHMRKHDLSKEHACGKRPF